MSQMQRANNNNPVTVKTTAKTIGLTTSPIKLRELSGS